MERHIGTIILMLFILFTGCARTQNDVLQSDEDVIPVVRPQPIEEAEKNIRTDTDKPVAEEKHWLVAIDPGHQSWDVDMSGTEPNAPGSDVMKQKATSGTAGVYSGVPEYELNMDISLMLKDELEKRGYDTLLIRENNETAISNAERAQMANEANADIYLRIHANGSENPSAQGALALIPSPDNPYTEGLYEPSAQLAETVLEAYCNATGFVY